MWDDQQNILDSEPAINSHILVNPVHVPYTVPTYEFQKYFSFLSSHSAQAIERWARFWVAEAQKHVWQLQWALPKHSMRRQSDTNN